MSPNQRIGDYEILGELGSGGMGRVYRVRNVISERVEAMKVLLPDLAGRQELAERFQREIKLLAALNHPNIASLRTALTVDNQLIMIMEYVEGQSLAERLAHGPIATADALTYLDQVLKALQYAHEQHVIHRDIKPANMMLTPQGVVKLMDFGIARSGTEPALTIAGTTTGSLSYMSPEQVKGRGVDARSDVYSLGISFYEMVTGQRPFQADNDYAIMEMHLREAPKPPSALQPGLSSELNDVILKAIAKDPAQRFQSADAFRDAISNVRPGAAPVTTSSRSATMVDTAVPAALLEAPTIPPARSLPENPMNQPPSDHARTIVDTRTPSRPALQSPRTSVPNSPAVQPPPARTGHPGMYMLLGGSLVVAALIGAALYIGRAEATPGNAKDKTEAVQPAPSVDTNAPAAPVQTAVTPETAPQAAPTSSAVTSAATSPGASTVTSTAAAPASSAETAAGTSTGTAASVSDTSRNAARSSAVQPSASAPPERREPAKGTALAATRREPARGTALAAQTVKEGVATKTSPGAGRSDASAAPRTADAEATPQEPAKTAVDLDELEREIDQLTARAGAVNSSLNRLQQGQARQGLGLRGDIATRQESLKLNLSRAQQAINQRDAARAQRYKGLTEADVDALERFLGR